MGGEGEARLGGGVSQLPGCQAEGWMRGRAQAGPVPRSGTDCPCPGGAW